MASNIHWHWTESGCLAGAVGVFLAWLVTETVNDWQGR
jgi:hypothetical protein